MAGVPQKQDAICGRSACVSCARCSFSAPRSAAKPARRSPLPKSRRIEVECEPERGCRVDLATYIGWRVFQAQCATCHAADVRGSSFAPDLTLRMGGMTQRAFFAALDNGYFGPRSTMPPRGRDPNVAPYYDELWSFLRARIDRATCRRAP